MKIQLLAFGEIAEMMGNHQLEMELNGDLEIFKARLESDFPFLSSISYSISVNHQIVKDNIQLKEGDIVALLPPFSGG